MIELYTRGSIFRVGAQAITNPVNTVGTMGAGLAKEFKRRYPKMNETYVQKCKRDEIQVGHVWIWDEGIPKSVPYPYTDVPPRYIVNFPTKEHWWNPSQLEWISAGLDDLRSQVTLLSIESLALPALGCGHGGLDFQVVNALIEEKLGDLALPIIVFQPR
jgi:O-acetyl-ADP-ribose deacetylase (regulator of RNase III)